MRKKYITEAISICKNEYSKTDRKQRMSVTHGAVLVMGGKIYGRGSNTYRNRYQRSNNSSMHSEVDAIRNALRIRANTHGKARRRHSPKKHHRVKYASQDNESIKEGQPPCCALFL